MFKFEAILTLAAIVAAMAWQSAPASAADVESLQLRAWGRNESSQLGTGTSDSTYNLPQQVSSLGLGVTVVAAGGENAYAIQNGTLYAWGYNYYGLLGLGNTTNYDTPQAVTALGNDVRAVTASSLNAMAIVGDSRTLYVWGANNYGQLGNGSYDSSYGVAHSTPATVQLNGAPMTGVTAIASSSSGANLAVVGGTLYGWGYAGMRQLGDPDTIGASTITGGTRLMYHPAIVPGMESGVTAIAMGSNFSMAIQNGKVYTWGDNEQGQLGNGSKNTASDPYIVTPTQVLPVGDGVRAIAAGPNTALAVDAEGTVWGWGLGLTPTPTELFPDTLTNIVEVAVMMSNSPYTTFFALDAEGDLYAWGSNCFGELGLGLDAGYYYDATYKLFPNVNTTEPQLIGTGYTSISVGSNFVLATWVPEPASLGLLALGGVAMMFRRRKH
ncbi:MAG: PEP-CTERM sorting domain-containing protein [Phycisphaerales bacterium]|nr:PEP-CTERM sorting domain-containing protein [Phycisphaerales bacterium]